MPLSHSDQLQFVKLAMTEMDLIRYLSENTANRSFSTIPEIGDSYRIPYNPHAGPDMRAQLMDTKIVEPARHSTMWTRKEMDDIVRSRMGADTNKSKRTANLTYKALDALEKMGLPMGRPQKRLDVYQYHNNRAPSWGRDNRWWTKQLQLGTGVSPERQLARVMQAPFSGVGKILDIPTVRPDRTIQWPLEYKSPMFLHWDDDIAPPASTTPSKTTASKAPSSGPHFTDKYLGQSPVNLTTNDGLSGTKKPKPGTTNRPNDNGVGHKPKPKSTTGKVVDWDSIVDERPPEEFYMRDKSAPQKAPSKLERIKSLAQKIMSGAGSKPTAGPSRPISKAPLRKPTVTLTSGQGLAGTPLKPAIKLPKAIPAPKGRLGALKGVAGALLKGLK